MTARTTRLLAILCLSFVATSSVFAVDVMPLPSAAKVGSGRLAVTAQFRVAVKSPSDSRLPAALGRALRRWEARTGLRFPRTAAGADALVTDAAQATLVIECAAASPALPQLGDDESYTLDVSATQAVLRAPTTVGAQRGLETFLQLLQSDADGWFISAIAITDQPRFPWRGLMIDVGRHWQPIEVIKRNLDGMALVKLNVFHFHLSEDQGFRVESKKFPRLQEFGSDGHYFTQEQLREIVAYAAERGIRVVPEFDIPGHAQSWAVGYPELVSAPGPYVIERRWGVFDPVLDPTNEATYTFLEGFLGEMAELFPDLYFHIGGDENNGKQWRANPRIQAFIKEHDLHDNAGLHAYFNRRVQTILAAHGKKLVGWDEILHPDLPKDAVIQSWRGAQGLADASRAGHPVILSNGYYIDLVQPASEHYLNDPLPVNNSLPPADQARVLGGEATMWSEWVSPETIDSRIWPRTAAIAERLWSPREVVAVDEMYRRLEIVSHRLAEVGLLHEANREPMLRRYAGDGATASDRDALRELVAWIEPVKGYRRNRAMNNSGPSQFIPLTGLADIAQPDNALARKFSLDMEGAIFGSAPMAPLGRWIDGWRELASRVERSANASAFGAHSREVAAIGAQLAEISSIGAEAIAKSTPAPGSDLTAWRTSVLARLDQIGGALPVVELPAVASLKLLVVAVSEQSKRAGLAPEAWRQHVQSIAFPKKNR